MPGPSPQTQLVRWLSRADPAGLMYGAIVSAAALATVSLSNDDVARVATTTAVVLIIYWMADLYVHALTVRFDGDARHLLRRLGAAAAHKASVLKGGAPAIAVYLLADATWADATQAAFTALGFTVVLLMAVGFLGARQAGSPGRAAVVEAIGAGMLGVVIVLAKSLLH